jgi:hypothetical protein
MSDTIELKWENDEGDEVTHSFPAIMGVCPECEGHGFTLREGLRGEAYTSEEFYEAFEEPEDREEYFRYGGKYDQQCPLCHGNNVIPVVNEGHLSAEQKKLYAEYEKCEEDNARYEAESRAERDAERRMGC